MAKTIQQRTFLAGALCAAAVASGWGALHAAPAALKVQKQSLKPTSVLGSGGSIQLKVKVNSPKKVSEVRAQAQLPKQPGGTVVALSGKNGVYQGVVPIPSNFQTVQANAGIVVFVTTPTGVQQFLVALVPVGAGSSLPPLPPPK